MSVSASLLDSVMVARVVKLLLRRLLDLLSRALVCQPD